MPSSKTPLEQARALVETVGVRVRDDLSVIGVSGEDARTWLNGQITNDIRTLEPGGSVYALAINVRGKIMADLWVLDRGTQLALLVPEAARQVLLDAFERQIIMEDVALAPVPSTQVISVQGPRAAQLVAEAVPPLRDTHTGSELGHGGVFVLVAPDQLAAVLPLLVERAEVLGGCLIGDDAFELARVRAGRGRYGRDFSDQNYPQEAGLKDRAVSFSKGCYLGQEVVCTLENRGRLTRALTRLEADSTHAPEASAELLDGHGHSVGRLTSVVHDAQTHQFLALGYVKSAHAVPGTQLRAGRAILRVVGDCAT
jgi:hypothetical protein